MTASRSGLPRLARVRDVIVENYRTCTVRLDASIEATPGQFTMLWLPGLDEKPFSVMNDDPLSFTISAVGPFSRAVHAIPPDGRIWFRGPFGRGFSATGGDHLLVGGGYGVAPLLFLARRLKSGAPGRTRAVIGARCRDDLLLVEALRAYGVDVTVTTEDGSAGTQGLVTDALAPMLAAERPDTLYACGPHGMLAALADLARAHGVPAQLSWEAYMRCGIGICGSCEHEGQVLCADGPVLDVAPVAAPAE